MTVTELRKELQKLEKDKKGDYVVTVMFRLKHIYVFDDDKTVDLE